MTSANTVVCFAAALVIVLGRSVQIRVEQLRFR